LRGVRVPQIDLEAFEQRCELLVHVVGPRKGRRSAG
jgi:hypothetical protein